MIKVSPEQVKKVCDQLTMKRCTELAAILNQKVAEYGITSWDEFHEFIGQVVHESGQFSAKVENMNYSAKRMVAIWPGRFPTIAAASPYARNPQKLANKVYGGRMGNTAPNDGWQYRGGGYIGLTGKSMYELFAKYKKMDVQQCSDWVRNTDEGAMDSAFWFFYVYRNLEQLAIEDNDREITRKINGGYINMADRLKYTELARKYMN